MYNYILIQALKKVDAGYRLPPPPGCPRAIYRVMIKCWYVFINGFNKGGILKVWFIVVIYSLIQNHSSR